MATNELPPGAVLKRSPLSGFSVEHLGRTIGWIHPVTGADTWHAYLRVPNAAGRLLGTFGQLEAVCTIIAASGSPPPNTGRF